MYKYGLLVLMIPTMVLSMDDVDARVQEEKKTFFERLTYPCDGDNLNYIKTTVFSNPDYVTLVDEKTGYTPIWVLVDSLVDQNGFRAATVNKHYGAKGQLDVHDVYDVYKVLFLFFLEQGASCNDYPAKLKKKIEEKGQMKRVEGLLEVAHNFFWRKARKALVECDDKALSQYLNDCPSLLDKACSDTGTTLLHEATMNLKDESGEPNQPAYGIFRLLRRNGAKADIPNAHNVTFDDLMSEQDEEGNYTHPGADLYHYDNNLPEVPTINFETFDYPKKVTGFFTGIYTKAEPHKEYILGGVLVFLFGCYMFSGSSEEPLPSNDPVLG